MFAAGVVLAAFYVVHGVRRGDPPGKILGDALPAGIVLFLSLPSVVPHTGVVSLVGMGLVALGLLWKVIRAGRR
jgi:hypothetical protein